MMQPEIVCLRPCTSQPMFSADGVFGLHRMKAASNSVQLHTLKAADTGLSRMLLWWSWKMGAASVNNVFYPTGTQAAASNLAHGLGAIKSLFQGQYLALTTGMYKHNSSECQFSRWAAGNIR